MFIRERHFSDKGGRVASLDFSNPNLRNWISQKFLDFLLDFLFGFDSEFGFILKLSEKHLF